MRFSSALFLSVSLFASAALAQGVQTPNNSATSHVSDADRARLKQAVEEAFEKDLKPKIAKIKAERAATAAQNKPANPEMVNPTQAAAPVVPKTNPEDALLQKMNQPKF